MRTGRIAAGLSATAMAGAMALVGLAPAQAATDAPERTQRAAEAPAQLPVRAAAAPSTVTSGSGTLTHGPVNDLAVTGAKISVQGKGFDTDHGLFVAVCADGSRAPADLSDCVGGAIPDGNTTQAWAHITADGQGSGGIRAAWGNAGSFDVTLTLPSVTGGTPNCVTGRCSLYTASDDDTVRSEDNTVPLTFAPPTSSSSTPPTQPTRSTAPTTASPELIASPTVVAGQNQIVVFSGFKPGEQVNLTLFSRKVPLPPVTASGAGVVQAEFTVPADTVAGTHRLEAIGQTSGTVGVASFQVTAPPPVTSASPTPRPTPSPTPSPSESSTAPASSSAPVSPTAVTSSAVTPSDSSGAGSLWWLWLLIAIVLIAGIVTGVIVWRRKQKEQREKDEADLAAAAAQEQTAGYPGQPGAEAQTVLLPPVGQPPGGPPPGQDPYGLLSGRDHPDNPQLYSGQDAGPTEVLGPPGGQPYQGGGYPPGPGWGPPSGGAPTQAIGDQDRPTGPLPPVPPARGPGQAGSPDSAGTSAWTPDFDDTDTGDDNPSGADGRPPQR